MRLPLCLLVIATALPTAAQTASERPNIVWIFSEDQSDHYGPFQASLAKTPNIDRMALEGAKFTRAFVTAPVCSPSRSALITGMYQTTIGAHNHRSGRGELKIRLPGDVEPVPAVMRRAGYYVTNGRYGDDGKLSKGKTDYNFEFAADLYDGADWAGRAGGQPFFAQVQLRGGKRRNQRTLEPLKAVQTNGVDPKKVKLPPYYPDHPQIRKDWAQYLESIEHVDWEVGEILERLEREGVADNTVVFFLTDHGVSHARGKQFLSEEGTRVPLVVRAPGRIEPGLVREDLVAHIDVAASSLAFAGLDVPGWMEGRPLFGPHAEPREYVVSARDRCDETVDRIRSVRTERFRYIRNFVPERPHLQPNRYKDGKAVIQALHKLRADGALEPEIEAMFYGERPEEELYDLREDPWEMRNLAGDASHAATLAELRSILKEWIAQTGDHGQEFEDAARYGSDMDVYLRGQKGEQGEILRRNIADTEAWREARAKAVR
ncbi:MAG: sulfatase [Bryobacterales bacterium]|nr:sulfatase [Bryobacterales bacterium]